MEQISYKKVKARKEHRCDWCQGTIKKGELYENSTNVDDGDIWTWKNHLKCMALYHKLHMGNNDWNEGVNGDVFMEYVYCFLQQELTNTLYEELDLCGEDAVNKAIELLNSKIDE